MHFIGNVEGVDIPKGTADVIVCDGFVGNVCLKMLEGVAETVVDLARYAYKEKLRWRAGLAMLSSGIQKLKDVTDWEQYGGAPVLGFDRLFIKAHGRSKARAMSNAGKVAAKAVSAELAKVDRAGSDEVSLPDRIDPRPPKRIYRWDLDKTYLQTDFDTLRQLVRTALQKASEKVSVPGAAALIRELSIEGDSRLCIISGSPKQMRSVLEEKLKLDGVKWDELVLKDNVRNILRGRFKALRGQVGYKLPVLLESRARGPIGAEEILFGDDAEADAFIYSLYADMVARRVDERTVKKVLDVAEVYPDDQARTLKAWKDVGQADPVRRIFIHLDRLTPPAYFSRYGPRVVPIFNYFQAALVLLGDGVLTGQQVLKVALEMIQSAGYNLLTLSNSFQDLTRRGLPLQHVAESLVKAMEGPHALMNAMRPVPDIVTAFTKRLAALGTTAASAAAEGDRLPRAARRRPPAAPEAQARVSPRGGGLLPLRLQGTRHERGRIHPDASSPTWPPSNRL